MNPDQLRDRLFAALARRDGDAFMELCHRYGLLILQSFPAWTKVPEDIRKDAEAVQVWAHSLIFIAEYFESLGYPELLAKLTGGDDLLRRWWSVYAEADRLNDSGQYATSTKLLLQLLPELEGASGTLIDDIRPKIYGLLGSNYFRAGDIVNARKFTELALADCQRAGDREGVGIYTANLRLIGAAQAPTVGEQPGAAERFRRRIARAQDLSDDARYDASNALLHELVAEMEQGQPDLAAEYGGKVYGLLGLNFFRLADLVQARRCTERALQYCTRAADEEGIRIYSANLDVIAKQAADGT